MELLEGWDYWYEKDCRRRSCVVCYERWQDGVRALSRGVGIFAMLSMGILWSVVCDVGCSSAFARGFWCGRWPLRVLQRQDMG